MKIILDTDIGSDIDDVYALAFALRHPELELLAVTTVHAYPVERARLVEHLLAADGRSGIPVGAGWTLPLYSLDADGRHAYLERKPNHTQPASGVTIPHEPGEAVRLILETVNRHAGDIALVTIGSLTNVAAALAADPGLAKKVRCIAMMAGELNRNHLEYNVRLDPEAADMVFRSGATTFVGTWDVSRKLVLHPEHVDILRRQTDPLCAEIVRCTDLWWPHRGVKPGPVLYDIAPLLWLLDRSWFGTRPMPLRVEKGNALMRGMTYEDPRGSSPIHVTTGFNDPDRARDLLLRLLTRE
jgi:inosine-uridine nucleoside N-ribohydrolase